MMKLSKISFGTLFAICLFLSACTHTRQVVSTQPTPNQTGVAQQQSNQMVQQNQQQTNQVNNLPYQQQNNQVVPKAVVSTNPPSFTLPPPPSIPSDNTTAKIQVAVLLDTSNSMDGLINQAKAQLWKLVNELALARDSKGNIPSLELALYEYGNDGLSAEGNYIRQVSPFTNDLDFVSERLFSLTTNGGSEYCGAVIKNATEQLTWNGNADDLKIIFIAGNEAFDQGPIDYRQSCKNAISKSILINTIFCGNTNEGINTHWKDGADLADGRYMNINSDATVMHINAPQDSVINRLNLKLNDTYIGYGNYGKSRKEMQSTQDSNAATYGTANAAQRAMTKASMSYKNDTWDMVDAAKERGGAAKIAAETKDEDLPEEMKKMTKEERVKYIDEKAKQREAIQQQISQLSEERRKYVALKEKELAAQTGDNTLDAAILNSIREQAKAKKYTFEQK
jgi:hypothetical protein